jgi:hypothetical protein
MSPCKQAAGWHHSGLCGLLIGSPVLAGCAGMVYLHSDGFGVTHTNESALPCISELTDLKVHNTLPDTTVQYALVA